MTVGDVLRALPDLTVLVPGDDDRALIRWVHVSELADPTPYLRGHELLLTAGVHLPATDTATEEYVERLAGAGVVGLGFGVDPVHHQVPERLVTACRHHGLPLLRVPASVPFIAVAEAHVRVMEESRRRAGEMAARAQQQIVRAAARPSPLQAIVNTLASQLQAGVTVADRTTGQRWRSGEILDVADELEGLLLDDSSARRSAASHEPGRHAHAQRLEATGSVLTLTVCSPEPLPYSTQNLMSITSTVVALILGHSSTVRLTAFGHALARAALGHEPADLGPAVSRALDLDKAARWHVLMAEPGSAADSQTWSQTFANATQTVLRFEEGDVCVAVIPGTARARRAAEALTARSCPIGLSDPSDWRDLPAASTGARRALLAARVQWSTAPPHGSTELPQLHTLVDRATAQGFAVAHLAPLLERSAAQDHRLRATLKAWLEHDGNWDQAAAALGVHRNTVRNRISTVSRLLRRDLRSASTRTDLWLALHWYELYGMDHEPDGVRP